MGDSSGKPLATWPVEPTDSGIAAGDLEQESIISIQAEQMHTPMPVRVSERRTVPKIITNVDPFANINSCTPEHIEKLATVLEIRGAQPRQTKMRDACFNAAGLRKGMSVLEIGCGTGVVTRELARIAGRDGRVVGIDVSTALLSYARGRTVPGGVPIDYRIGNAYDLDFADDSFDASCSITLLAHLQNLQSVVSEMIRVTRQTVMLLDQDYQTLVFENSDTKMTRKILQHGADYNVLDGWCGRKLPGLLVNRNLHNVQCWPFVYAERDSQSYLITIAERFAALAVAHDVATEDEARVWLQELYDRAVEGSFFASLNYYFAFGIKRV
ncbi:MAG TPA: methyltransferase domain-containing protein [Kofleriaceae bacterium]